MLTDSFFMNLALNEAWKYQFLTYPNPAVGALVTSESGEILSIACHKKAKEPHAEVLALLQAFIKLNPHKDINNLTNSLEIHNYLINHHNNIFNKCTLYTTLSPCNHVGNTPACSNLLKKLSLHRVVIGAEDPYSKGSIALLKKAKIVVDIGIQKLACNDLLSPFLFWKEKKPFIFFKLAQHINGTYDDGVISNITSRKHVHAIRDVIDTLIVGGNTVRMDKPTLDTRLINSSKNPNIIIYSHKKNFNKSIPLFNVANRTVKITNKKEDLLNGDFSMVEGGNNIFNVLKDDISWLLLYLSSTMVSGINMQVMFNAKIMHIMSMGDNYLFWMKRI